MQAQIQDWILGGNCSRGELKRQFVNYYTESITNNSSVPLHLPGIGALVSDRGRLHTLYKLFKTLCFVCIV